jgi:sec-independent protein translocase protein TatC
MFPPEEKQTASPADGEASSGAPPAKASEPPEETVPAAPRYEYYDDPYGDYGESYGSSVPGAPAAAAAVAEPAPAEQLPARAAPPPPPPGDGGGGGDEFDDEEEGMVRMSFFDHLAELRMRILYALGGLVLAFALSLTFANTLWDIVSAPAVAALKQLKVDPPELTQIAPMEAFNIVWIKLPLLCSIFIASPWLLYQLWAFIAPGLYKRERRWAAPFVISTASLFVLGGVFAYFVVFRFALVFLLGLGIGHHIRPLVSTEEYFDIFVNVMLGIGIVFELPVLIFFLSLIRVVTSGFLMRNIRYAILIIHIIAAVVTPTPDVFNMELFAMPMCLLFFVGVGAAYILELRRDQRKFPWGVLLRYALLTAAVIGGLLYLLHARYGYHFVHHAPWFAR